MASALSKVGGWWCGDTVAVVTGGNRGVGYEIVKGLAKNGLNIVLTSRDQGRGQKAVETLNAEGLDRVVFHPLDVTSDESIAKLALFLKREYSGLDILINNEATYSKMSNFESVKACLATNYYGVKRLTTRLPLLKPSARVVNITSPLGQLELLKNEALRKKLDDEEQLTEELVDSYAAKYLEDVKTGRWEAEGWSTSSAPYSNSKILLNAYTRSFAKLVPTLPYEKQFFVNAVNPGYTDADEDNQEGPGTAEEGAETAVWLVVQEEKGHPNGKVFFKKEPQEF